MSELLSSCPNCGADANQDADCQYCAKCGQNNSRERLRARSVLLDAVHNFFGWDAALACTLRSLAVAPGRLVSEYVEGKRRKYVNPARFCLLSSALWFFGMHLAGLDPMENASVSITGSESSADSDQLAMQVRDFLSRHLDVLSYLSLPFLALALRLLFRKSGRNLAECLVLVLFLVGLRYLASTLFIPVEATFGFGQALARLIFGPIWMIWAASSFFGVGVWSAIWRVMLALFLHMFSTIVLFGAIAIPWVLLHQS